MNSPDDIDALCREIAQSPKYRRISVETIRDVASRKSHRNRRQLVKSVRETLHRVLSTYHLADGLDSAVAEVVAAVHDGQGDDRVRHACRRVLDKHMTSHERMPLLELGYYRRVFETTGVPATIADMASALHPFEYRWMELPATTRYRAYDNNRDLAEAAGRYLGAEGVGRGIWSDVLVEELAEPVDLAFFLMTYHCLENRRSGAGWQVVAQTRAQWMAVSLPTRNFGGRTRKEFAKLGDTFRDRLGSAEMYYEEHDWSTETLFLIHKEGQVLEKMDRL